MLLGIDASSIRSGGALSHLAGVLWHVLPQSHGFSKIVVWCNPVAAGYLEALKLDAITIIPQKSLDGSLWQLAKWQLFVLPRLIAGIKPDILWSPGGILFGRVSVPTVMMSQNLLPFEPSEMARYGLSLIWFKFLLLRYIQLNAFKKAKGIIFLSKHARDQVVRYIPEIADKTVVIPHGIDREYYCPPRKPAWPCDRPVRLLYVSSLHMYKHQWQVVAAVEALVKQNYHVELDLAGPAYPPALRKLNRTLDALPRVRAHVHYHGSVPHVKLAALYHQADIFVFASTCETISFIVLEAMAAGLPIACSNRQPMPEVLGDAGVYFDPEKPEEIAAAIRALIDQPERAFQLAQKAHERAQAYSWERCANDTFAFMSLAAHRDAEDFQGCSRGR
ncbi:MAG: glycosyltransferase family 1 protein [Verrucomicrobiota bacterium]